MRNLILFFVFGAITIGASPVVGQDQSLTTVILIRHAEKVISDDPNPELTEQGMVRAEMYKNFLKDVPVNAIYSTNFIRTKKTVAPIAEERNIRIRIYEPSELETFAALLASRHRGQTVLVVGHSNTTPALVNALSSESTYKNIDESEYDFVFMVDLTGIGRAKVKKFNLPLD